MFITVSYTQSTLLNLHTDTNTVTLGARVLLAATNAQVTSALLLLPVCSPQVFNTPTHMYGQVPNIWNLIGRLRNHPHVVLASNHPTSATQAKQNEVFSECPAGPAAAGLQANIAKPMRNFEVFAECPAGPAAAGPQANIAKSRRNFDVFPECPAGLAAARGRPEGKCRHGEPNSGVIVGQASANVAGESRNLWSF